MSKLKNTTRESANCPFISVILPVYNQGKFLAHAIDSVIQQTSSDWELIIVNDGSSDHSLDVAKKYLKSYSKIKLLDIKHSGVSKAINSGFSVSTGSYITTLGADDYYKPNHLMDNSNFLKNNQNIDLLMSKVEVIGSPYVVDIETPGQMIHLDECAIGGTFFVKRAVFKKVGGRPPVQYGTDYQFVQKVIKASFKIHKRSSRTYVYDRTGESSITKDQENIFLKSKK